MSYVRWSSDDFRSDVYAYESDCGFMIHLASKRIVGPIPTVPPLPRSKDSEGWRQWFETHRLQDRAVHAAKHVPIGGPCDGETFCEPTEEAMYERLRTLRGQGYHVPADVLAESGLEERCT